MNRNLMAQMVGYHHACLEYDAGQFDEYYEFLREGDEFAAAAAVYTEERNELLANAAHRYQLLIDWATARLKLNIAFLNKAKVWFNFYADMAGRFGIGTQAYTTETTRPHIGISELSLQDVYFLQLILIHEMQHATDYVNYDGLNMPVAERELRARISICEALYPLTGKYPRLYREALLDESYWYIIFFHSPAVTPVLKKEYYALLKSDVREQLANPEQGVIFTPLVLRALAKELNREGIRLSSRNRYLVELIQGQLVLREESLPAPRGEEDKMELLEELMVDDTEAKPASAHVTHLSQEDLEALTLDFSRDVPTTKNKVTDWQPYEESYQKLKEKASVVIRRDRPAFENIHMRLGLETGPGLQIEVPLMPQALNIALNVDQETYRQLDSLVLPEAALETKAGGASAEEAIPVHLQPLQSKVTQRHNIGDGSEPSTEEMVSNLSEFVKEKGGR